MRTRIVRVDPENPDLRSLEEAAEVIRSGGLVAFPTETVYGLGANAFDPRACSRIFEAKGRPKDNPLIVHIGSREDLDEVVRRVPDRVLPFIERLWPGPLTVILEKSERIPGEVTAGLETVAVRFPSHPIARALVRLSGVPIAAPSANLSGRPSPTSAEHVIEDLMGRVEMIIDGGETFLGLESTIIDFTEDPPLVLRPGPLTVEQLREIGKVSLSKHALGVGKVDGVSPSPGLKYRHYAPRKPLILVENPSRMGEVLSRYENPVVVCVEERKDLYKGFKVKVVGSLREEFTIARNLFRVLRELDDSDAEVIIFEGFPERGILLSVMNRLRRASSERVI